MTERSATIIGLAWVLCACSTAARDPAATNVPVGGSGGTFAVSAGSAAIDPPPVQPSTGGVGGVAGAGASGASAGNAGSAGGAGSAGVPAAGSVASMPADAGSGGASPPMGPATGTFPPIDDPWAAGPFEVDTLRSAGPAGDATVLYPRQLGQDGLMHPIVVWDNGKGQTGLGIYGALLEHLASHGFAVYAAYSATDQGSELTQGLDWMIAQASAADSPLFGKLDTTKAAAMGHSQGSIATFAIAADPRLRTTIHLSGGTNPDIAQGHDTLPNLRNPAAFICGEPGGDGLIVGDVASEWCAYDFEHTDVPVFLAQIDGASHITAPGMTLGACAAWLRWQLMDDTTQRAMFAGPDCTLCQRPGWVAKSKGL